MLSDVSVDCMCIMHLARYCFASVCIINAQPWRSAQPLNLFNSIMVWAEVRGFANVLS